MYLHRSISIGGTTNKIVGLFWLECVCVCVGGGGVGLLIISSLKTYTLIYDDIHLGI